MKIADKIIDAQLVSQCLNGDKKSFTLLVARWHFKFCKQAYWYTKNKELAKDIAQDSWSIIFEKLYTLRNPDNFGSWALSIVNRKSIDTLRKEKRIDEKLHNYYEDSKLDTNAYKDYKNTNYNNDTTLTDATKTVVKAIKNLPRNQQLVLQLFYVEEYSIKEISKTLKVSKGTVKSRLFYAREKLKSILKSSNYEK